MMSMKPVMSQRRRLLVIAATDPMTAPMNMPMAVAPNARPIDNWLATSTLARMSRPRASVPKA